MAARIAIHGGPLALATPASIQELITAINRRLQKSESTEQAIQEGTYISTALPGFWDVNHGTFEAAHAQVGPISREFRRIYDRLMGAKDIAEQPTVPRGDESAVTRRLTNGDLMQIAREINVANAPWRRVQWLLENHLYVQGGGYGYIGNSHGHAPPAGARLVHIEGTMVPPPEPNPDADTEDEGEDMAGRGMPVNRHMDTGKLTHEWRNRRYGW